MKWQEFKKSWRKIGCYHTWQDWRISNDGLKTWVVERLNKELEYDYAGVVSSLMEGKTYIYDFLFQEG